MEILPIFNAFIETKENDIETANEYNRHQVNKSLKG